MYWSVKVYRPSGDFETFEDLCAFDRVGRLRDRVYERMNPVGTVEGGTTMEKQGDEQYEHDTNRIKLIYHETILDLFSTFTEAGITDGAEIQVVHYTVSSDSDMPPLVSSDSD